MKIQAREGDLLESREGLIFDVKGLIHPAGRIIAFLRYYPEPNGDRLREGIRYIKIYDLEERYAFLKANYPHYLFQDEISGELLQGVPIANIKRIYQPIDLVKKLCELEKKGKRKEVSSVIQRAFELIKLIQSQSKVNFDKLGITGSSLVQLETKQSDIDLMVYGSKNAFLVKDALIQLYKNRPDIIQPYSEKNIGELYEFRGKGSNLGFKEFVELEQRKILQGIYQGINYYIRCIKDWNEIDYQKMHYEPLGKATIRGFVVDDSEAIFTPCKYAVKNSKIINGIKLTAPIHEIVSFRGRFCEQGRKDEEIEACGKIEKVIGKKDNYFRLLVGTYKEDYFRVLNL